MEKKMWFKSWLFWKKNAPSDEARELSLQNRRLLAQIRQQQLTAEHYRAQAEAAEAKADLLDIGKAVAGGGSEADTMLMQILAGIFFKGNSAAAPPSFEVQQQTITAYAAPPQQDENGDLSDEQINKVLQELPANAKALAKIMPAAQIVNFVKNKYPQLSEQTIERGVEKLKNGNY